MFTLRIKTLNFILIGFLFGTACGDVVHLKNAQVATPEKFKHQKSGEGSLGQKYWEDFQEPQLNDFIETLLQKNSDLKAAVYRIDRDFAVARIKGWDLVPSGAAHPSYQRQELSKNTGQPIGLFGIPRSSNLFTLPLDFSYEIDLWGRVRNQLKAARAQAKSTYFQALDLQALLIQELVKNYFALKAQELKREALQHILDFRKQQFDLAQQLKSAGFISETDMLERHNQWLTAQNNLAYAQLEKSKLLTSMAILLGESPSSFDLSLAPLSVTSQTEKIPQTLPSEWIRLRPDILSAEQKVIASNAMTRSALAEFFPKITFNARFGAQSLSLSNLVSEGSRFFSLGPTLSIPLFDIGRNVANYKAQKASAFSSLEEYKKTVLSAFKDVEDRLAEFNDAQFEFENYYKGYQNVQKMAGLELSRHQAGFNSLIEHLDGSVQVEENRVFTISKKYHLIESYVHLMKSFGAGAQFNLWMK